jgi:hypothetical protein
MLLDAIPGRHWASGRRYDAGDDEGKRFCNAKKLQMGAGGARRIEFTVAVRSPIRLRRFHSGGYVASRASFLFSLSF